MARGILKHSVSRPRIVEALDVEYIESVYVEAQSCGLRDWEDFEDGGIGYEVRRAIDERLSPRIGACGTWGIALFVCFSVEEVNLHVVGVEVRVARRGALS